MCFFVSWQVHSLDLLVRLNTHQLVTVSYSFEDRAFSGPQASRWQRSGAKHWWHGRLCPRPMSHRWLEASSHGGGDRLAATPPAAHGLSPVCHQFVPIESLNPDICQLQVLQRTVEALAAEGRKYIGVLYGGFMLTKAQLESCHFLAVLGESWRGTILVLDSLEMFRVCAKEIALVILGISTAGKIWKIWKIWRCLFRLSDFWSCHVLSKSNLELLTVRRMGQCFWSTTAVLVTLRLRRTISLAITATRCNQNET